MRYKFITLALLACCVATAWGTPDKSRLRHDDAAKFEFSGTNLTVLVNDAGLFTLHTNAGANLLYPSYTGQTIFRIDGESWTNSGSIGRGLPPVIEPLTVVSPTRVVIVYHWPGITIAESLTLQTYGGAEYLKVSYWCLNEDSLMNPHDIGVALLYDVMVGSDDNTTFGTSFGYTGDASAHFTAPSMPTLWRVYEAGFPPAPTDVVGTGLLSGFDLTNPDELAFGSWGGLRGLDWRWVPDPPTVGDGAVMLWWYPRTLEPGSRLDCVTAYGGGASYSVEAGDDRWIMPGGSTELNADVYGGAPPYTYNWSPATGLSVTSIANPTATPAATTRYTVTVSDMDGFTCQDSVLITVRDTAVHEITIYAPTDICAGSEGVLWTDIWPTPDSVRWTSDRAPGWTDLDDSTTVTDSATYCITAWWGTDTRTECHHIGFAPTPDPPAMSLIVDSLGDAWIWGEFDDSLYSVSMWLVNGWPVYTIENPLLVSDTGTYCMIIASWEGCLSEPSCFHVGDSALYRTLTVSSDHGSPSPPIGTTYFFTGTTVTADVPYEVVEGGHVFRCDGWTGTGSVPLSGTDHSVTFALWDNSSLHWLWSIDSGGCVPVTGVVIDSLTGLPLENIQVVMQSLDTTLVQLTNRSGHFSFCVPPGDYYAWADGSIFRYRTEFYEEAATMLDATIMALRSDPVDLAFTLTPVTGLLRVIGNVRTPEGLGRDNICVVVISTDDERFREASVSNAAGRFQIDVNFAGWYYMLAFSLEYIPTFYPSAILWGGADSVFIGSDSASTSSDLVLREATGGGRFTVSGTVWENLDDSRFKLSQPLPGTRVFALTPAGEIVSYALSSPDGNYRLLNLPDGEYDLVADRVGYYQHRLGHVVASEIDPDPAGLDLTLYRHPEGVETTPPPIHALPGLTAWPNPFRNSVHIETSGSIAPPVRVLDLRGRTLRILSSATAEWDGRNTAGELVPPGVYVLEAQLPEGTQRIMLFRVP